MRFEAWLLLFALFQLQPQRKRVFFFRLHFLFGLFLCLVRFYCFWMVRSARLYAQFSHWDERTHTRTFTQSISFFCVCIKMYRSDLQAMHNEFLAEKCVCVCMEKFAELPISMVCRHFSLRPIKLSHQEKWLSMCIHIPKNWALQRFFAW